MNWPTLLFLLCFLIDVSSSRHHHQSGGHSSHHKKHHSRNRHHSLQCIDDDGHKVDWYIVYKYPRIHDNDNPLFDGHRYATVTSRHPHGWRLSPHPIDHPKQSIFAQTLASLYRKRCNETARMKLSYLFYNDQKERISQEDTQFESCKEPKETEKDYETIDRATSETHKSNQNSSTDIFDTLKYAHSKGLLASYGRKGFWLIHSVPQFPPSYKFVYPRTGLRFGQTAFCISLRSSSVRDVVQHLRPIKPLIYDNMIAEKPKGLSKQLKKLVNEYSDDKQKKSKKDASFLLWNQDDWIDQKDSPSNSSQLALTSLHDVHFLSFFKSGDYNVDLYADMVAPGLKSSLLVETWRKNPGHPLNSSCKYPRVENVESVAVEFVNSEAKGAFGYLDDHSKWAVSDAKDRHVVCLGDINRMASQFKRGGSTTCIRLYSAWKAFHGLVAKKEACE